MTLPSDTIATLVQHADRRQTTMEHTCHGPNCRGQISKLATAFPLLLDDPATVYPWCRDCIRTALRNGDRVPGLDGILQPSRMPVQQRLDAIERILFDICLHLDATFAGASETFARAGLRNPITEAPEVPTEPLHIEPDNTLHHRGGLRQRRLRKTASTR